MIFISPFICLSEEKESKPTVTQADVENIYYLCARDFLCIVKKCRESFEENECVDSVIEYGKKEDAKLKAKTGNGKKEDANIVPKTGKWLISRSNSPMDDSKTVTINLYAINEISGYPSKSFRPVLYIRCKENKTEVFINIGVSANPEYGLYNKFTVRIRLDDNKFLKQRWSESTNGEALFAPKAISLARKLNKSKRMLFEFTPYNSNSQLAEFDVQGLEPYLKELSKTCNWNL